MSFTSTLISQANIGSWTYYVMSDNTPVWRALNGVAAWFGGNGGLVQGAALLGSLLLLMAALYGAAVHGPTIKASTVGTWLFFVSSLGITGTANIVNIYTNAVTSVANVPALIIVPASIFSTVSYKVFSSMDTALQAVSGSYLTVTQNAFVGPLDLLLSLRSNKINDVSPQLQKTLAQVVHDCAIDPSNIVPRATTIESSLDMVAWLQANGRQTGLTKIFVATDPTNDGTISSCAAALTYVNAQYDLLGAASSDLMAAVNQATNTKNPQDTTKGLWTAANMSTAYANLMGASVGVTQTAVQFTKNALTSSIISNSLDCLSQTGSITAPDVCGVVGVSMADGLERYKTDSAMAGSGFLKTMFTSMGFLQVIFFSLFPFIALYGVLVPNKTASVVGGYLLFGVWTQSWLLAVAPIQSYIQNGVIDEMSKLMATSHGMTMANTAAVYSSLSTKLAVASDLMASSQMLMLALLSGSIMAMSSLVGKFSGSQHMDSTLAQKKLTDTSALNKETSMSTTTLMSTASGSTVAIVDSAGATQTSLASNYIQNKSQLSSNQVSSADMHSRATALQASYQNATGLTLSDSQASNIVKSSEANIGATASIGAGVAKGLVGGLFKGVSLSRAEAVAAEGVAQKATGQAITKLAAKDVGFMSKLYSDDTAVKAEAWGTVAETGMGLLTAGALAADLLAALPTGGAAAAAAPAILAGGTVAAAGAKAGVKSWIKSRAEKAAPALTAAENVAGRALSKGAGGLEMAADAIGGNVQAAIKGAVTDGMKRAESVESKKGTSKEKKFGAGLTDTLTDTMTTGRTKSFNESSGKGETSTSSITLDNSSLMAISTNGINGQSGAEVRQNAASTAAMLRSGGGFGANGEAIYSPEQIKIAQKAVATATQGHTVMSNDTSISSQELTSARDNILFERFLTGAVTGSFGGGNGLAAGAQVTSDPKMQTTPSHAAVAATMGHWSKDSAPTVRDAKQEATNLKQWMDGGAPTANHVAAAHAGYHWSAGSSAQPAVTGHTGLATETAMQNSGLPGVVNRAGVGASVATAGSGRSAEYNAAESRVVEAGSVRLDKQSDVLPTTEQHIDQKRPGEVAAFNAKKSEVQTDIAITAGVQIAASAVAGALHGIREARASMPTAGSSAPADKTGSTPATPEGTAPPKSKTGEKIKADRASKRK